jgi:hypothetical protein
MNLPNIARLVLALLFLAGGLSHIYLVSARPSIYEGFADLAFWSLYKSLWQDWVLPHLKLWIALLILFEFAVGALLLGSGVYPQIGLALAAAFMIFLIPFWWGGGALANLVLLALVAWLLRFDYAHSILTLLFRR